jgi:hypothetical protein
VTAGVYDITIEQGSVFTLPLVYKDASGTPINITGYKARMQVKKKFGADPLISLTSDAGDIVLGGALGTITAKIIAPVTATLTIKQGVYDLDLIPPSGEDDAFRLVEGAVIVTPEVTTA